MMIPNQKGMATVEIAITSSLFFLLLFAAVDVSRMLFVWNSLADITQRGARAAAVCPEHDPAIANIAIFNDPYSSGLSTMVNGLETGNIAVDYLDAGGAGGASGAAVAYVQVSINGYVYTPVLPDLLGLSMAIAAPSFKTTLPRESLGKIPDPDDPAPPADPNLLPDTPCS